MHTFLFATIVAWTTKKTNYASGDGLDGTDMSESPSPLFTVHDELLSTEIDTFDAGLGRSNDVAAPLHDVRHLACFARLPDGDVVGGVIGGAVGRTWGS